MIDLPPENESMGDTNHFIQDLGFGCSGKAALHAVIQKKLIHKPYDLCRQVHIVAKQDQMGQ